MSRLDHWLARNDLGGIGLRNVKFRPSAVLTCPFGVAEGYRMVDGLPQFGWARIHTGADRAGAQYGDGVFVPLPHDASTLVDYHGEGYGSLIRLTSQEWEYELRIAHMHPAEDILPEARDLLDAHQPLPRGMRIGKAGRYGVGSGRHSHGELVAWSGGAEMFIELAWRLHGDAVHMHETDREVLDVYRGLPRWREATDEERLTDYAAQRTLRGIEWSNRFRHVYTDPIFQRRAMRFNTWLVLGM